MKQLKTLISKLKRAYYRLTKSPQEILQVKADRLVLVAKDIKSLGLPHKVIITPTGDFIIVEGKEIIPVAMVQADDLGLSYTVCYNSLGPLSHETAQISTVLNSRLNIVKELVTELAFDTQTNSILAGDAAASYRERFGPRTAPELTIVN